MTDTGLVPDNANVDIRDDAINCDDIFEVARLARLAIDEQTATRYAEDIDKILHMMQLIANVDTADLTPLSNVHEAAQQLRADVPDADIDRAANQAIAPAVAQGLYLVPQVID